MEADLRYRVAMYAGRFHIHDGDENDMVRDSAGRWRTYRSEAAAAEEAAAMNADAVDQFTIGEEVDAFLSQQR